MDERPASRTGAPVAARVAVAGVAVVVAVLAAPIPTRTWQATAVTVAVGLVAVGLVVAGRPRRVSPNRLLRVGSVAPWFVLFAAVMALELGALAYGDRLVFPTVSWLVGPWFVDPAVRLAGYVVWICAGYWLVRR